MTDFQSSYKVQNFIMWNFMTLKWWPFEYFPHFTGKSIFYASHYYLRGVLRRQKY